MRFLLQLYLAHVRLHPARLILTTLAVIASACIVVWVVSGYDALLSQFDDNANKYLGRYDIILLPNGPGFPPQLREDLANDPLVAEANPVVQSRVTVTRAKALPGPPPDDALSILSGARPPVNGCAPLDPTLTGTGSSEPPSRLVSGNWLTKDSAARGEAVLSSDSAKQLKVNVGDQVVVTSLADQKTFTLIGIVEQPPVQPEMGPPGGGEGRGGPGKKSKTGEGKRPGKKGGDSDKTGTATSGPSLPIGRGRGLATAAVYVPMQVAERLNGYAARANAIQVALKEGSTVSQFRSAWDKQLSEMRPPVQLIDFEDIKARLSSDRALTGKQTQAYSATGMALLAAIFIIFTALSMGVFERAREFSILRAIGLTRSQVAGLIFIESISLALIGWLGGLIAGWALLQVAQYAKPDLFPSGTSLGWWCIWLSGASAGGGALLAAILPMIRATRVRPLDAMSPHSPGPSPRWPYYLAVIGLLFLLVNPVLVYSQSVEETNKPTLYTFVGYPAMVVGMLLLTPVFILLAEKLLAPVIAFLLGLNPALLQSQLSSNLWRTLGTTVALTVGLGLFVSTQTWGYSMLKPFYPGDWLPDMLVAFQPVGLSKDEALAVSTVKGVRPGECLPLAVEQTRMSQDLTKSQTLGPSSTRQDNVIIIGLDPERAFLGKSPLIRPTFEGDTNSIVTKLKSGRFCLIPDHFAGISGLKPGDTIDLVPPNAPDKPVQYTVAGVVSIPGWHWITKFSGLRRHSVRTAAIFFAPYEAVRDDFQLKSIDYFWFNTDGKASEKEIEASMQTLIEKHAGETFAAHGAGDIISYRPSARVTATETIQRAITSRADAMIWGMGEIPLVTLLVTSLAVVNTIAASVRARRWEMGVLRATGVTRSGLFRLVLAEGILIGLVACLLSLAFGLLAGWCGTGMSKYVSFFGGMETPLIIPWSKIAFGFAITLALCLIAALWPAFTTGRTEPLQLLKAGRSLT
ncbi:MAG: ABC transporter permease [Gemmatales bacterium]